MLGCSVLGCCPIVGYSPLKCRASNMANRFPPALFKCGHCPWTAFVHAYVLLVFRYWRFTVPASRIGGIFLRLHFHCSVSLVSRFRLPCVVGLSYEICSRRVRACLSPCCGSHPPLQCSIFCCSAQLWSSGLVGIGLAVLRSRPDFVVPAVFH